MPKFVHIDISADDPSRAAEFYHQVFGWTATKLEGPMPYWLMATDPANPAAVGAGIGQRSEPWQTVVPTIDVSSADEITTSIIRAGGSVVIPKTMLAGVGYLVTFRDTEGNILAALEASAPGA
ncbi:MAG TPA: VOC family protein [Devosia sp.]